MKTKVRVTLLSTAVILLIMLLIGALSAPQPMMSLRGTVAVAQDIYNTVFAPGEIEAEKSIDFTTARTATVTALYVKAGDVVKEGQPLLRLRETTMTLSKEAAQAFAQQLMEGNVADEDAIAAALQNTNAAIGDEYTVTATMAGTIMRAPNAVGQNILPGLSYLSVADLSKLRVRADIPEAYIKQVQEGQRANITSEADPDVTVSARVESVAPFARRAINLSGQEDTATVEALLNLQTDAQTWRPGYSVDVKIFTDAVSDAVLVPYEAIVQEGTKEFVFVVDKNGIAHKIYVETGYELDGYIEIKSGVRAGEIVLLSPPDTLQDGDLVEVRDV